MFIPKFWAESQIRQVHDGKQITIRRFGWSMSNTQDAQSKADARVAEAIERILSGEKLVRREPKHAYNGAEGVPIREEIVEQYGETIITRNAYGARCLNSPNVFIADIDFPEGTSCSTTLSFIWLLGAIALLVAWWNNSVLLGIVLLILAVPAGNILAWAINRSIVNSKGGNEEIALERVRLFGEKNPSAGFRVYRTPLGMRVIATHRTFEPNDSFVEECFRQIAADARYAVMCKRQACFRARVSPKPWRIGITRRLGGGVWPISENLMQDRLEWIDRYEKASRSFASCSFVESIGSEAIHPEVRETLELHDRLCQSESSLPIA